MPDVDFKTVSASQVPDLLNISPWGTRLMLHHQFVRRVHEDRKQSNRMKIGKLFEALILELTAAELALEVQHNTEAAYLRHPTLPLGCTVDATVLCPTRGYGVVEAKAIDKYEFIRSWTETAAPAYYEAQHQEEMMIPHPVHGMPAWGVIACFVYNEGADGRLVLYERLPNEKAQARIALEAEAFMADVAADKAPPAFGLPVELGLMSELYPEADEAKVIEAEDNFEMAEHARMMDWARKQKSSFEKAEKEMKPKLLAFMQDAGFARLAGGVRVRVRKPQMAGNVVMLPADLRKRLHGYASGLRDIGQTTAAAAITEAAEWCQIMRVPGVQNRIVVTEDENAPELEIDAPNNLEA